MNKIRNFWLNFILGLYLRMWAGEGDGGGGGGGAGAEDAGKRSLLNGGGGGGGGGTDWRASLPEDIRGDASLANIKAKDATEALALISKGYVHAQKLVGVDKIPRPNDKWTPEQWKEYHKAIGVPETHDKYTLPDVKLAEGLSLVPEKLDKFKQLFHKAGMTPAQVSMVMQGYLEDVNGDFTGRQQQTAVQMQQAVTTLKQEFGDKYDAKLDIARATLKKFGNDELLQKLEATGLANDPSVVKMLAQIGEQIMDDRASGGGGDLIVGEATEALQQINALKGDATFMKQLNNRNETGHKEAVAKWMALHQMAAKSQG